MTSFLLARRLHKVGFPQTGQWYSIIPEDSEGRRFNRVRIPADELCTAHDHDEILLPTLTELIAACGDQFGFLLLNAENGMWLARSVGIEPIHPEFSGHHHYDTPEEAVAKLWLALNPPPGSSEAPAPRS